MIKFLKYFNIIATKCSSITVTSNDRVITLLQLPVLLKWRVICSVIKNNNENVTDLIILTFNSEVTWNSNELLINLNSCTEVKNFSTLSKITSNIRSNLRCIDSTGSNVYTVLS